jgi:Fungal protein kinase
MCPGGRDLVSDLISALQNLPAARALPSGSGRGTLRGDLARFALSVESNDFDVKSIIPLLIQVVDKASDAAIWRTVSKLITESTPPPRQLPYPYQTPISFNTSSFVNTSENRKQFDGALKEELESSLYIDVPGFFDAFFGDVASLTSVADIVFKKCKGGKDPLYSEEGAGWRDWPKDAKEEQVLKWLKESVDKFLDFAKLVKERKPIPNVQRRPLGQPNLPLLGSATQRKLDVGFANDTRSVESPRYDWSQILVPGELKSNPNADRHTSTWLDLARYARHVLTAQDNRRFVLGFTLCGSTMRLWEFDRLGGIASSPFDINTEGQQFVSAVLGYLWMNNEQLGFDPTISEENGRRYIKITRNGKPERLIIDKLIKRHLSVAGRATTCWKTYREGDKSKQILIVKDSWQYPEREEEGELLRDATEKGVVNVARYYHHETVHVGDSEDDVNGNIRKGLDILKASNAFRIASVSKAEGKMLPPSRSATSIGSLQSRSRSTARKRSLSSLNAPLPSSKRTCSSSPHKQEESQTKRNRVRRRVVLRDYGKGIHKASSRVAMLAALEGNITGKRCKRDWSGSRLNNNRA